MVSKTTNIDIRSLSLAIDRHAEIAGEPIHPMEEPLGAVCNIDIPQLRYILLAVWRVCTPQKRYIVNRLGDLLKLHEAVVRVVKVGETKFRQKCGHEYRRAYGAIENIPFLKPISRAMV
ncbi:hypothetical protein K470DRAFT_258948 [Piedraia hortae CBS 480.64]|uniref:Uncharacterized protein n=1 Tax=Piedraia hortae CBS 480.64 TaxID=1314780 RepID=A0A6A7BXT0_9PEZI|nr:hypothetical protein K470DRAFT_258948 [Piedraia hortae CBS 480.64]